MHRLPRALLWSFLVLAAPALSGCANFDPDSLDIFGLSEKKKLPGERQDLFPEGVPGVSQGIPPEYIRGNTATTTDSAAAVPAEPAPPPQAAPAPAPAPQRAAPRRTVTRAPRPAAAAAPVTPVQSQPAPAAQQAAPQQAPASGGWPAPAQGSTQQGTTSSGTSAWPAPQPSGTFQR